MGEQTQARANRALDRIAQEPLKGAWRAAALIIVAVTLIAGVLIRLTDPGTFTSVWSGLWWAVQTTTTVGYGDRVPESVAGRVVATVVMVAGIGFITVSTAAIASAFVESSRRRREREQPAMPDDVATLLRSQTEELAALRREVARLAAVVDRTRTAKGPE